MQVLLVKFLSLCTTKGCCQKTIPFFCLIDSGTLKSHSCLGVIFKHRVCLIIIKMNHCKVVLTLYKQFRKKGKIMSTSTHKYITTRNQQFVVVINVYSFFMKIMVNMHLNQKTMTRFFCFKSFVYQSLQVSNELQQLVFWFKIKPCQHLCIWDSSHGLRDVKFYTVPVYL